MSTLLIHCSEKLLARSPLYQQVLTLVPVWINNYNTIKCGVILLILSQSSMVHPMKFAMDKLFHPRFNWACDYLSMLRLKLIHDNNRDPRLLWHRMSIILAFLIVCFITVSLCLQFPCWLGHLGFLWKIYIIYIRHVYIYIILEQWHKNIAII